MANKWYGKIGFSTTVETTPGVWTETFIEREYYGDVLRLNRRWQSSQEVNDNITINNQISIVSDIFATNNLGNIRYIEYMGSKWKVSDVSVEHPRLILSIGEVYNA